MANTCKQCDEPAGPNMSLCTTHWIEELAQGVAERAEAMTAEDKEVLAAGGGPALRVAFESGFDAGRHFKQTQTDDASAPVVVNLINPRKLEAHVVGGVARVYASSALDRSEVWLRLLCASVATDAFSDWPGAHVGVADTLLEQYDKRWTKEGEDSADTEDE